MKLYKPKLSEVKYFKNNGFLILKNVIKKSDLTDIKSEIYLISKKLYIKYYGVDNLKASFSEKKFDIYLIEAKKKNLSKVTSSTYDACKKIYSYISLFSSRSVKLICSTLMGTQRVGILNRGFGVRIDFPGDRYYKARLHQDYTSQIGSKNGLVLYLPLRSIRHKHGPVVMYKGSHLNGVRDTIVNMDLVKKKVTYDPYHINKAKNKLGSFKKKELIINEGDLAFFDFCLLHKSGLNVSKEIRWSMISRYMDFNSKDALEMDYIGGQHEGNIFRFKDKKPIKVKI